MNTKKILCVGLMRATLCFSLIAFFSAQSPQTQKRMKRLERTHGFKKSKKIAKVKKSKQKSSVYVVKEKPLKKGIRISRGESRQIVQHYDAWKKEKDALEKQAKKGNLAAQRELKRRTAIEVHLIRVAKIKSLFRYAKRAKKTALVGQALILMDEENTRFKKEMEKIQTFSSKREGE